MTHGPDIPFERNQLITWKGTYGHCEGYVYDDAGEHVMILAAKPQGYNFSKDFSRVIKVHKSKVIIHGYEV